MRKFARELGVPLAELKGTGLQRPHHGRGVQAFTRSRHGRRRTNPGPGRQGPGRPVARCGSGSAALAQGGLRQVRPHRAQGLSRIKKISGANLLRNAIVIPAVTNHDDADITDLEAFRVSTNKENEKGGVKVTMLAFLIKACVAALKNSPSSTAAWTATR